MKSYNFHLISLLVLVVFFSVLCPQKSRAALTKQLSYQGRLNSASGQPVANGTYSIVFSIYNVSMGGSALWTETQNVSVESGGFSAYLGSVTPLNLPFNEDYYLGIKVGSDPEMTPRLKLAIVGTSAFSLEAGMLQGKAASDFALSTHTHTLSVGTSEITDGSITASDIDATAVQKRVTGTCAGQVLVAINQDGTVTCESDDAGGGGGGTPASTVTSVGASNVVGTSTNYAREDHQHNIVSNFITDSLVSSSAGIATSKLSGTVTAISGHGLGSLATLNAVSSAQITDGTITFTDIAQNGCASGQVVEWNGTAWNCGTDDVGGGGGVITNPTSTQTIIAGNSTTTPLVVNSAASPSVNIFDVQNNGTSAMKVSSAGNLLVGNPATTNAKVSAYETGTANNAGYFQIGNASNSNPAVYGITNGPGYAVLGYTVGTSNAGNFQINNATNSSAIIKGDTGGTGNLLQLQKSGVDKFVVNNTGNLLVGNPATTTAKVSALETGTANHAGYFEINNASSAQYAVFGSTNGLGDAVYGYTTGTGIAGEFQIINASNASDAIKGTTTGTGRAGFFQINNATNSNPAVYGITNGTGNAVYGYTTSTGGKGGYFEIDNASNANSALNGFTIGTGNAGNFQISNASNSNPVVVATTNGTGVLFKGNTTGAGNLFQLQQGGVDKFVVDNAGNITVGGAANTVKTNPSSSQAIIAGSAGITPLSVQAAATPTAPIFNVWDSGAVPLVQVASSGNLLVGNPGTTAAKLSVEEAGTANYAGYFKIGNASNANASIFGYTVGTGDAVYGYTIGTGKAGYFRIDNVSNAASLIQGNTTGTGNLIQLQQAGINKFVVDNVGNVLLDGNANPSIKASGATPNLILDADGSGASIVTVKNTTSPGNVMLQVNGNITAFSGTNSIPVSNGVTQQIIQTGNICESLGTDGNVTVTFAPSFAATPTVTFGQTGGTTAASAISGKNSTSFTVSGFETGGTVECIDWIAVGNK